MVDISKVRVFILYEELYDDQIDRTVDHIVQVFSAPTYTQGYGKIKEYLKGMTPKELYLGEDDNIYPRYWVEEKESL